MKRNDMMFESFGYSKEDVKQKITDQEVISRQKAKTMPTLELIEEVVERSRGSMLLPVLFTRHKSLITELATRLDVTQVQAVLFAACTEFGVYMDNGDISNFFGCSNVKAMMYQSDFEAMVGKRMLKRYTEERTCYKLRSEIIEALRSNIPYVYQPKKNLDTAELFYELDREFDSLKEGGVTWQEAADEIRELFKGNRQLTMASALLDIELDDKHLLLITFLCVALYISGNTNYTFRMVRKLYPGDFALSNSLSQSLKDGTNTLIKSGWVEYICEDGMANKAYFCLTRKSKQTILADCDIEEKIAQKCNTRQIASHTITPKTLIYNKSEYQQIKQLSELLTQDKFREVQQRLADSGLRKGFACLFYGEPGVGKTETVYQLARTTGRNIIEVNVEDIKSKWVGESEQNISQLFKNYHDLCRTQTVTPILLFNEADAVLGIRKEGADSGVDKMENSLQNIILQEMEKLEGIMIATTNLTDNLDKAFERRFIYKVQFNKPELEAKVGILHTMLPDLTIDEAESLARKYDMTGGMIENIARKRTVNYILTGREPDIKEIEDYCKTEILDTRRQIKHVSGFSA